MSVSGGPALQEYYFTSISKGYYFHQRGMFIDEEEKIAYPKNNKLKKTPHSITFQCMRRGLGHLAAHMKDFIKDESQINILKIPQILMKISK